MPSPAALLSPGLPAFTLAEAPFWDSQTQKLYWVDIAGQLVLRAAADGSNLQSCRLPAKAGFVLPSDDDRLVAGMTDGLYAFTFENPEPHLLARPDLRGPKLRFNDGKCDPRGRLWCGTIDEDGNTSADAALYAFRNNALVLERDDLFISNGLGWSPDGRFMYHADTANRSIWRYRYDLETGQASQRDLFATIQGCGHPDGLCVDTAGHVYVALYDGCRVTVFDENGEHVDDIVLPVPNVTSCAFGGADLRTLYITTARENMDDALLRRYPQSGCLFAAVLDVQGQPGIRLSSTVQAEEKWKRWA